MGAGFLREVSVAFFFGTSGDADALALAMFYVDGATAVVITGLAGYLMVPVVTGLVQEHGDEEGFRLLETCLLWVSLLSLPLFGLGALRMGVLADVIAPGFPPERRQTLIHLLYFALPSMYLILLGGVMGGVLQARRDYYSPVHGRTIFALATAAAILGLARHIGILAAGVGLLFGGLLQFALQLRGMVRLGWRPQPPRFRHRALAHAVRVGIPTILALVLINVLMGGAQRVVASGLADGAFSALNYAQRSLNLVSGLTVALATVSLTELSMRFGAEGMSDGTRALLRDSIESGFWILVPLTVLLFIASEPLIGLLFHRGRYDVESLRLTASCLRWLALSVVPGMLLAVLHRAAPAFGKPWRSTVVSAVWTAATVVSTIVYLPRLGAGALAAGFATGTALAALASVVALVDLVPLNFYRPILSYAIRITVFTGAGLLATLGALRALPPPGVYDFLENVTRLAVVGTVFLATTTIAAALTGEHRTVAVLEALVRRARAVAP